MAKQSGNQRLRERFIEFELEILLLQFLLTYAPKVKAFLISILDALLQKNNPDQLKGRYVPAGDNGRNSGWETDYSDLSS